MEKWDIPEEGEWDINAKTRMLLNGDAEVGPKVRELVDQLQQENWRLRVHCAHLKGERITSTRAGRGTFQTPRRTQSQAANRASRRFLQRIDAAKHSAHDSLPRC